LLVVQLERSSGKWIFFLVPIGNRGTFLSFSHTLSLSLSPSLSIFTFGGKIKREERQSNRR
jgi:hypothetical protein